MRFWTMYALRYSLQTRLDSVCFEVFIADTFGQCMLWSIDCRHFWTMQTDPVFRLFTPPNKHLLCRHSTRKMISASRRIFFYIKKLIQYFDCLPIKINTLCRHSTRKLISASMRILFGLTPPPPPKFDQLFGQKGPCGSTQGRTLSFVQVFWQSKSSFWKRCWQPFVDMINSEVFTHLWKRLNLSARQKVAKSLFENEKYYKCDAEQNNDLLNRKKEK